MARSIHSVCGLIALVPVLFLLGCSGSARLGKVSGTVTIDGKPVPKGTIVFEMPGRRPATGVIENGQIRNVTSHAPNDGASVGENKVAITSTQEIVGPSGQPNIGEKEPPKAKMTVGSSLVPKRYNDPSTSGLTADIKSGDNVLEFSLTSK